MSDCFTKYYLAVPFENKEEANWSEIARMWYVLNPESPLIEKYKIINLNVKYKSKDNAKNLGAKFNYENKKWYCTPNSDPLLIELYKI